ncbi:unnamed protein product [Gongylonema pulchrum]|uniref:DUF1115 domain-containing protein n=1 Tax=Gongylonema pulchrum TaxID=637853 RepID=A0A183DM66_9BILA|nr:unnamed protein product [Gongylonema pulchrum]
MDRKDDVNAKSGSWARFWIYSHHIRNPVKRRKIEDAAVMHNLNGFFCAGKPGIIVVEGLRHDCDEFWAKIRPLKWQRIVLRHSEELSNPSFFRFTKFREHVIPHANFSTELRKMLTNVGLEYGFELLLDL